jgi:hypothetical protein
MSFSFRSVSTGGFAGGLLHPILLLLAIEFKATVAAPASRKMNPILVPAEIC